MTRVVLLVAWALFVRIDGASLRSRAKENLKDEAGLWRPCANEGETIAEEGLVRFGIGLTFVEGQLPRGATCSVATFRSDPSPGIVKMCECAGNAQVSFGEDRAVKDDMGLSWTRCASEGENCKCDSGTVRFGSTSRWVVTETGAKQGSQVLCSTQGFGGNDPASGQNKECWCQMPDAAPVPVANPTVAIVLLTRRPPDLKSWLQYHLDYMQVKHVFMDVEDTPHFNQAWATLSKADQDRVTVWRMDAHGTQGDKRPSDDYTTLQARQLAAMSRAKAVSKEMGIDWLIHIDDDELLYAPLHKPIGQILSSVPTGYGQAYLPNVEAIYKSSEVQSCFTETNMVNMDRYSFVSYANGKAAVRVADDDAEPAGPHQWKTSQGLEVPSIHLDAETFGSPVWLVHFESCPFVRWEDKFWELGNTSPAKIKAIPFPFYKDSITRMRSCRARKEGGESFIEKQGEECSEAALKDLWSSWKTARNPKIKSSELMPITIPWAKIKATSSFAQLKL